MFFLYKKKCLEGKGAIFSQPEILCQIVLQRKALSKRIVSICEYFKSVGKAHETRKVTTLCFIHFHLSECIKVVSVGKARETGISHESPI